MLVRHSAYQPFIYIYICITFCYFAFYLFQNDGGQDDSFLAEGNQSPIPGPSTSEMLEEEALTETPVIRSTKCPTSSTRKRRAIIEPPPELSILENMQRAMESEGAEDNLDSYGKVLVGKLRLIDDPMKLFLLQNEIDQVIFKAVTDSREVESLFLLDN